MRRVFTNSPDHKDFVATAFAKQMHRAKDVWLAAPFFSDAETILSDLTDQNVHLIVELNGSTKPEAIAAIRARNRVQIRYFTENFHAKVYIFDEMVLVGSANLSQSGFYSVREAMVLIDRDLDPDAVDDLKGFYADLWEAAKVLTQSDFDKFKRIVNSSDGSSSNAVEKKIVDALGHVSPKTVHVITHQTSAKGAFLEQLKRQVYEEYLPAFQTVHTLLSDANLRRFELVNANVGPENETNRFLNWVRKHHAPEDTWQQSLLLTGDRLKDRIMEFGREWITTDNPMVDEEFIEWLLTVKRVFGDRHSLEAGTKADLEKGLSSIHAFEARSRFVKGGRDNLIPDFWHANGNNEKQVRQSLLHLLYGSGDPIERLHDVVYVSHRKIRSFGTFCALELYGTIHPETLPPVNGRIAKALRFLGFKVVGD